MLPVEQKFEYPRLVRRYKALFIDAVLLMVILITIMIMVQDSNMRTTIMVTSGLIILLTYEPVLTTYSRTVGQRIMKIRVGKLGNPTERIGLTNAFIRWSVKWFLGWLSFVTIHFNPERRAIHDIASSSVMTIEK